MCNNEHQSCKDDVFRLTATGSYRAARLYLDKQKISFKLNELRYLLNTFRVVQNQDTLYILAVSDVMTHATAALSHSHILHHLLMLVNSFSTNCLKNSKRYCKKKTCSFPAMNWTCLNLNQLYYFFRSYSYPFTIHMRNYIFIYYWLVSIQTAFQVGSITKYTLNSHPERSAAIRPESLNHMLTFRNLASYI